MSNLKSRRVKCAITNGHDFQSDYFITKNKRIEPIDLLDSAREICIKCGAYREYNPFLNMMPGSTIYKGPDKRIYKYWKENKI